MFRRTLSAVLALLLLVTPVSAADAKSKSAKDLLVGGLGSGLSSAASWGAQFLLNTIAGGLYTSNCGDDQVVDEAGELLCSIAGSMSGQDDAKWRLEVDAKLEALKTQLDLVLEGQKDILDAIDRQSAWLRQALDKLPAEVRVHDDLSNIRNAWSAYQEFFAVMEPKTPEAAQAALRKLAKDLLHNPKYNVEASARDLRLAIADGVEGMPPLPMLLAQEIDSWIRTQHKEEDWNFLYPADHDIRPHYERLELAMQEWMLRQKQAQVMYLWAARTLEGTPDAPRLTAKEYGKSYLPSIEAQFKSFQRAVEWLVLANSFPRSPYANFLPAGADEVFRRADAVEALQLSSPLGVASPSPNQAVWGRVIAMGEGFDGGLRVKAPGRPWAVLRAAYSQRQPLRGFAELDWWSASNPTEPLTYDVVHFGKEWTVYRFKLRLDDGSPVGDYRVAPLEGARPLPFLSETIAVDNSLHELTGRTSTRFGSFLGISRAGGGYALFSGDYTDEGEEKLVTESDPRADLPGAIDWKVRVKEVRRDRGSMPRLVVGEKAVTKRFSMWTKDGPRDRPYSVERSVKLILKSDKKVRSADGNRLHLHVLWDEATLGIEPLGERGDRALVMINDPKTGLGAYYMVLESIRFGLFTSHMDLLPERKGVTNVKQGFNDTKHVEWHAIPSGQHDDVLVDLPRDGSPLVISTTASLHLPAAGGERSWVLVAKTSFQTVYLTR